MFAKSSEKIECVLVDAKSIVNRNNGETNTVDSVESIVDMAYQNGYIVIIGCRSDSEMFSVYTAGLNFDNVIRYDNFDKLVKKIRRKYYAKIIIKSEGKNSIILD